jgi:hypothetical protein
MPYVPASTDHWEVPNPDPARHYRWLSRTPEKLSMWLRAYGKIPGYRLERGPNLDATKQLCERLFGSEDLVNLATNRIEFGDNALASIPIEEYHRRKAERMDEALSKIESATDEYLAQTEELASKGIKTFIEPEEETASRREFHTRENRPVSGQTGVGRSPGLRSRTRTRPRARAT